MKSRYWVALALLGLLGACTYRFLGGLRTDVYHGQVIDAERGTPISDAVVTVVWYRAGIAIESHPLSLLDAQETVTDNDGRFSLRVSPGLDWNPLSTRVDEPAIVIYKPGYEPLWAATAVDKGFQTNDDLVSAMKSGTTIKLRTLEAAKLTDANYISFGEVLPGGDVPIERISILIEALNRQRQIAGIKPYPKLNEKGAVQ